jgi:hypothetical protein
VRSKIDVRVRRPGGRAKRRRPPGGKALQRLFQYLLRRDPIIIGEVVAAIPAATAARPPIHLGRRAKTAAAVRTGAAPRKAPLARPLAAAIVKAATALSKRRRGAPKSVARGAAGPAPGAGWQPLGPSRIPNGQTYGANRADVIGRVACVAIDPGKPSHLLCGAAAGGIWESFDRGLTWTVRTDHMPSLAIGALAFDPTNARKVYAGSGEGNFYFNLGAGVYRSTDGGTTWTVLTTAPFLGEGFYDLVIDSSNPKVMYAATTHGFFVSTNAGASWTKKRGVQCWDISLGSAGGPGAEILAAFGDGLFVSTTGGGSFTPVALPSAPAATWDRLAVDRVSSSPDVAYAFGAAGNTPHLWRRSGSTWKKITSLPAIDVGQAWYDWYVAAPPNTVKRVYLGAIDTFRGDLGSTTWSWKNITTQGSHSIHPDQHCLAFAPGRPTTIYLGGDGGLFRSATSGASWKALNRGLGITELEYLAMDPATSQWLLAGTQDNGTIRYEGSPVWSHVADGDGGDCGVNHLSSTQVYHSYYGVSLERSNDKGDTWTLLSPPSMPALFYPPVEVFGTTVAIGGASVVVSRNSGTTWKSVSLGLPAGDVASAMDVPDPSTIFVGTRQGRVLKLAWTGAGWSKSTLASPTPRYVSCLTVDPGTPKRLWVTISQIGGGLVYRSEDTGASWVNCTAGLPAIPMNSVAVDPANSQHVWVAADVGVYESVNLGGAWSSFSSGLPNAIAADLVFHKKDRVLVCGTRNRGAWAIAVP